MERTGNLVCKVTVTTDTCHESETKVRCCRLFSFSQFFIKYRSTISDQLSGDVESKVSA